MDPAVFWSGFGGAILGGVLSFAGGWLQVDMTLRAQRRESVRAIYQPIVSAVLKAHTTAHLLVERGEEFTRTDFTDGEKAVVRDICSKQLSQAEEQVEALMPLVEWLLLDGDRLSKRAMRQVLEFQSQFADFAYAWRGAVGSHLDTESLVMKQRNLVSTGDALTDTISEHLAILKRPRHSWFIRTLLSQGLRTRIAWRSLAKWDEEVSNDRN